MKTFKSLEESGLLLKRFIKTGKNETKEPWCEFFSMLLRTLGVSLLGNFLSGKGVIWAGDRVIRANDRIKMRGFLLLPYSLANIEIRRYYQKKI